MGLEKIRTDNMFYGIYQGLKLTNALELSLKY
jgi:hypothetical protein